MSITSDSQGGPPLPARATRVPHAAICSAWLARLQADAWLQQLPSTVRTEFAERHLTALTTLVAMYADAPSAEVAAIYRDEIQRFELEVGRPGPADRDRFLAAQRAAYTTVPHDERLVACLDALNGPLLRTPTDAIDVLMLGDCVMNEVRCFLAALGLEHDIAVRGQHAYFSAALGQPLDLEQIRALLADGDVDAIALSPFTFDGLPIYRDLLLSADDHGRGAELVGMAVALVEGMVDELAQLSDAPILLHNASGVPVGPARAALTSLPPLTAAARRAIEALNTAIAELVRDHERLVLVDEVEAVAVHGLEWASEPALAAGDLDDALFHTSRLGQLLAFEHWRALAMHTRLGALRMLAVDFDNTLWAGVCAEGPVTHHLKRQRVLDDLARAGVLLVGLSTGPPEVPCWGDAALGPDRFLDIRRDWRPKLDNLGEVLDATGIRPEHVAVIDDDPTQRGMLAAAFPGLTTLDAGAPGTWRRLELLRHVLSIGPTDEARGRLDRYRGDRNRRQLLAGRPTYAEVLASLELTLIVRPLEAADLSRAAELFGRTNQFNTTGPRLGAEAIARRSADPGHRVHVADLRDRFGNFGTVAVVIVDVRAASIDGFAMSCRAMGYGVEQAVLAEVVGAVGQPITGRVIPTRLNEPCHLVYAAAGFAETETGVWTLPSGAPRPVAPAWIRVDGAPTPTREDIP